MTDEPVEFSMKDGAREEWQRGLDMNTDPYGRRCYTYAAQWARLMEAALAEGVSIADAASPASRAANTDGITGFMYGVAVGLLSRCWVHGEELRRWHNLDTQIGDEGVRANEAGTVLNPAMINIGMKANDVPTDDAGVGGEG